MYRLFCFFTLLLSFSVLSNELHTPARTMAHILSYLAQDYGGAVQNGKIVSKEEYQEQREFAGLVANEAQKLTDEKVRNKILPQANVLKSLIENKADEKIVSKKALELKAIIFSLTSLKSYPDTVPQPQKAVAHYQELCVRCHGSEGRGDGIDGKDLQPAPANFWNEERMAQVSPFMAFNTIVLGVEGTGMAPFSEVLSEEEMWNLAYYVTSLRHKNGAQLSAEYVAPSLRYFSKNEIASKSDAELIQQLITADKDKEKDAPIIVASIRANGPYDGPDLKNVSTLPSLRSELLFEVIKQKISYSLKLYEQGDLETAKRMAVDAYLEGFEPLEPKIKSIDPDLVSSFEGLMGQWRENLNSPGQKEKLVELQSKINMALTHIETTLEGQKKTGQSFWAVYFLAISILLREGLEALLIVVTILSVLRVFGQKKLLLWAHSGWILAVVIGVASWFFSGLLLKGMHRELMEAIGSILAVIVLLGMGLWLHSKSEIEKWKDFITQQTKEMMSTGRLFGIASLTFVATFREAFESVLFLRAISINPSDKDNLAILWGTVSALFIVLVIGTAILRWGKKLPLGKLFSFSALTMLLLSVILAGKGAHALQETGHLSTTLFTSWSFELVGFFPSIETTTIQIVTAIVALLLWNYGKKQRPSNSAKLGQMSF